MTRINRAMALRCFRVGDPVIGLSTSSAVSGECAVSTGWSDTRGREAESVVSLV
jgi:hypothetical protein